MKSVLLAVRRQIDHLYTAAHACNPSTQEAEVGRLYSLGYKASSRPALGCIVKPCLKTKQTNYKQTKNDE
jgi:hypothetical protein